MEIRLITSDGVERSDVAALPDLFASFENASDPRFVWVDIPSCDDNALEVLRTVFGFHPRALEDCRVRNVVPKLHLYPDHSFFVLHGAEPGMQGHVHNLELDQFVSERYLVTVHGPLGTGVTHDTALVETRAVAQRLDSGRLHPRSPHELSHAVVTRLSARLQDQLNELTQRIWNLERLVTAGHFGDAEQFLEEMFRARHGLLSINTMASLDHEIYDRMVTLAAVGHQPNDPGFTIADLSDQFRRIAAIAETQRQYLQGVIEFYQTRTNTKMTIAAERLSVIAAVTLPVTAISSIMGMNVIVSERTEWGWLWALLAVMTVMSALLLAWARRQGWW
jgi:Mg2+ and Co2+ transporter CorA